MEPDPGSFTVLVIDDDSQVLELVSDLLASAGHRVVTASSGPDGLMCARHEQPDLILVDYHMARMNGLAVVQQLKADVAIRRIPIVALTSASAAEANELGRAGCIGFIRKPFDPPEFRRLIADILKAAVGRNRRTNS